MEPLSVIRDKLAAYPEVHFEYEQSAITVPAVELRGFAVTFYACPPEYIVSLGGWHDHFKDPEKAIETFFVALTAHARLQVVARGSFEYKWTLEIFEDGIWQPRGTDALLFSPFWRKRIESVQQNNILPMSEGVSPG